MKTNERKIIGHYLLTWAGMFLTANGGISGRSRDAHVYATFDAACAAADGVPANLRPVLVGRVFDREDAP